VIIVYPDVVLNYLVWLTSIVFLVLSIIAYINAIKASRKQTKACQEIIKVQKLMGRAYELKKSEKREEDGVSNE
jgi:hypothetical protein